MTAAVTTANASSTIRPVKKFLIALLLMIGLTAALQPTAANARDFGGHGWGGHGWGDHCCGYWGPAWGIGLYAPFYGWGPYPYGYAYPYYYDPAFVAPVVSSSGYGADVWSESARAYHQQAYMQALNAPLGQEIPWNGGGVSGTVTAVRDGHSGGQYCREFLQKVVIDGHQQQAYGAACQTPGGGWQVVPDNP